MKQLIGRVVNRLVLPHSNVSYGQCGEDLILSYLFHKMGVSNPVYLDIGANDPAYISNTYMFYLRGSRGVCVEPNPELAARFKRVRSRDTVLQAGIGTGDQAEADFYLFPPEANGLSTFSKEEADYWGRVGMKHIGPIAYEKVIRVPLITINAVLRDHFPSAPDFLSIDVEGLDLSILRTLDYERFGPKVICVETLSHDEEQREGKDPAVAAYLTGKGYRVHADTHVNTIFTRH